MEEQYFPLLTEALPTMASALRESLQQEGEDVLARQVDEARIYATCACGQPECGSVSVMPPAERETPCPEYRVVTPRAVVTVGVCHERLEWIEDQWLRDDDEDAQRSAEYRALQGTIPALAP